MPSLLLLACFVGQMRAAELRESRRESSWAAAWCHVLRQYAPALAIAQLVAVLFALLCYRRQVRYGASRSERLVWTVFVLLLGLPGWIGYRFGRSWPVLESCPACSEPAPRDRLICVRCAADFPTPARRGTEVFA